jgi:hypothetical protein
LLRIVRNNGSAAGVSRRRKRAATDPQATPATLLTMNIVVSILSALAGATLVAGGTTSFADPAGDAPRPELDLRKVTVTNTADAVSVSMRFPKLGHHLDEPDGYLQVFLDTDPSRPGPEFAHLLELHGEHVFAPTSSRWKLRPGGDWSPTDVSCLAGGTVDHELDPVRGRYTVTVEKAPGCFEADDVRVAVTAANYGGGRTTYDHLGRKHAWSGWVAQG